MWMMRVWLFVIFSLAMVSCKGAEESADGEDAGGSDTENDSDKDTDTEDKTEALFDPDRVIDVKIELDPDDWDELRYEGRGMAMMFSGCKEGFEYTYFEATATIDGEKLEHVAIRKKGYLGSLSVLKPSLKLNFGRLNVGQTYSGMKRITLNNDRQDPSHTHQVMSYALFREAGVVAPRCNFARVTVNGMDLGIYSHVESIKKPFLARHFDDDGGNLYEGQGADFCAERVSDFERKTNETDLVPGGTEPDRSDLQAVVDALAVEDSELVASLEQVIDFDAFMTFWAMEVITGHWDGYAGDRNNFYIYRDPTTDLFHFIPWGTDGAFAEEHGFLPDTPRSVYAWSELSYRLYMYPETRTQYQERLSTLLTQIWDEDALLAEVDRIEALVSPEAWAAQEQRNYLTTSIATIQSELENGGGVWWYPPISEASECRQPVEVSGTFDANWSAEPSFVPGDDVSLTLTMDDELQNFITIYNKVGHPETEEGEEDKADDTASVSFYAIRSEGNPLYIMLNLPLSLMAVGEVPLHGFETFGMVFEISEETEEPVGLWYIGNGAITFDAAGTSEEDEVSGSFKGLLTQ